METYRPDIQTPHPRMLRLPIHRGYPVPWFVAWINGVPEFRAMDPVKFKAAIEKSLCWVCGQRLNRPFTFVIGPMCGINRVSAEPPAHHECATYSAINCPFLAKPQMTRRRNDDIEAITVHGPGQMIERNPGVTAIWTTRRYQIFKDPATPKNGVLFRIGDPERIEWYREGRTATRAEIDESVKTGLPFLREMCSEKEHFAELEKQQSRFESLLPA